MTTKDCSSTDCVTDDERETLGGIKCTYMLFCHRKKMNLVE